jgi:spoIIIJ-associated protein
MTENHEFNAATVEEALSKASRELGLTEEELSYEVLDTGSSGFLGMGSRDARIVVASETPPENAVVTMEEEPAEEEILPAEKDPDSSPTPTEPDEEVTDNSSEEEHAEVSEELLGEVRRFASYAVDAMGLDARIDVYDTESFIAVDVASDEAGLFIGQKGETINAFQYLLNVAVYRDRPYAKRIVVDSEGYRQRRVEAVQGIAHRMARKAVREGRSVELPPMNTSERRIVHIFLRDNAQVSTASQGTGESRRVTVSPS